MGVELPIFMEPLMSSRWWITQWFCVFIIGLREAIAGKLSSDLMPINTLLIFLQLMPWWYHSFFFWRREFASILQIQAVGGIWPFLCQGYSWVCSESKAFCYRFPIHMSLLRPKFLLCFTCFRVQWPDYWGGWAALLSVGGDGLQCLSSSVGTAIPKSCKEVPQCSNDLKDDATRWSLMSLCL